MNICSRYNNTKANQNIVVPQAFDYSNSRIIEPMFVFPEGKNIELGTNFLSEGYEKDTGAGKQMCKVKSSLKWPSNSVTQDIQI